MTLQTLVVFLIGIAYGWRLAVATVLLYLAEGAVGLPVFAGTPEKGIGLAYMVGPTGGYLLGFVGRGRHRRLGGRALARTGSPRRAACSPRRPPSTSWAPAGSRPSSARRRRWRWASLPFLLGDAVKLALVAALAEAGLGRLRRLSA